MKKLATLVTLMTVTSMIAPVPQARAASIPWNLVTVVLSLGAGLYSIARLATATVEDGGREAELLMRLADDAALFVATDGEELSGTLGQMFAQMREKIAETEGDEAATRPTDLDLARQVITAAQAVTDAT
jgi:hypothetical protein